MDKEKDAVAKIDEAIAAVKKLCVGLTFAQKTEVVGKSADLHNWIMHIPITDRNCSTCEKCCLRNGVSCCAAREMAEIPFQVVNRVGGCSQWYEKDYIPF